MWLKEINGIMVYMGINNDLCGNPRCIIHFCDFLRVNEYGDLGSIEAYNVAKKRANKLGGSVYRGKNFGGGFVFQSWSIDRITERINEMLKEG